MMIIDRQAFFRAGIRQALSEQTEFDTSDCDTTEDPLALIEAKPADVVLLGINPPAFSSLDIGRKIARHYPNTRVIALSSDPNDEELFEVIKTGAVAYLSKNDTVEKLVETIKQAANGQFPINDSLATRPKIADSVLRQFQNMTSPGRTMEAVAVPLSRRETQILGYIAEGNSNKQIARLLEISEQTIKNHVSSILRKLNANDRAHAVALALRNGWIEGEEHFSRLARKTGHERELATVGR